ATPPAMPAAPPQPPVAPVAAPPSPAAHAAARPAPAPITIVFAKNATDLSDADIARLKALAAATQQGPEVSFDVTAYASGTPEDPSSARRLSLSRGLAVRAALVSAGVPSVRIYVRAMGLATGPGTPDRADVSVHGLPAASGAPHS
ncbi:MAG: OmpA family protein, partial [Rhodospirillales bacterium]|nr:OmpA family protein [Rhodospirillales bacterium]